MATVLDREQLTVKVYDGAVDPDWCPGCGDFGVLNALKKALLELELLPHEIMVVSGIGCSSNLPGYIHSYGVHSLHGRSIPVATGLKLANTDLNVIVTGGDGDGYGIGMGHFIHAMRRNLDLTYIVMNNQIYGLTTGQASPTTMKDVRTKTTPRGNVELPINPLALAIVSGATYVARAFSGNTKQLSSLFADAIAHKGFSLLDVFSPCVTYNKINTYAWFKERVYDLAEEDGYDPSDPDAALKKSFEWGDRIPLGLIYQSEQPTYEDSDPILQRGPLVKQPLGIKQSVLDELLAETM
ncbi:MAG: 2-oxoacid:ferredoxin oxidoreductase subunit beta [Anaerolineae bacterium]|nr:2-oxoacid:ferredoxin oxidoreductase subunit beta [Anaerolineae bacterium]MDK1080630.1 2-oxoacid:ferredoxin oxidoreductase subunit beta [Anaerolineae bacterium]